MKTLGIFGNILSLIFIFPIQAQTFVLPIEALFQEETTAALGVALNTPGSSEIPLMQGAATFNWQSIESYFFDKLNEVSKNNQITHDGPKAFWKGLEVPHIIHQSLLGNHSLEDLQKDIHQQIEKSSISFKNGTKAMSQIALDKQAQATITTINKETLHLAQQLESKGHTVIFTGNYNREVLDTLREKNPELNKFTMLVSADLKRVKSPDFYKELKARLNLNPHDTIFVESHQMYKDHLKSSLPNAQVEVCTNLNKAAICIEKFAQLVAHLKNPQ